MKNITYQDSKHQTYQQKLLHVNTLKKYSDSIEVLLPIFWEIWIFFQYNIEKKENSDDEEEDEDEDDDDFGGGGKKAESDDPAERKIPISAGNSTAALRNFLISSVERTNLSRNLFFFWEIQLHWNQLCLWNNHFSRRLSVCDILFDIWKVLE